MSRTSSQWHSGRVRTTVGKPSGIGTIEEPQAMLREPQADLLEEEGEGKGDQEKS